MEKRSVMIAFPGAAAPEEIQSNASTWGELKKELQEELSQDFYNQKVRDHKTNHHYNDDNAVLADEPLKLLVSTDKNKSGGVTKANYHKAPYGDLRTFCKKMTDFAPNGKDLCIAALDKHYGQSSPKVEAKPKATKKAAAPKKEAAPKKGKVVKEKVAATPKKGSVEERLTALEDSVFGGKKAPVEEDDFMKQARNLS